ncbi:hypothetical protein C8Q73DRAFT_339197 [Cubamyces lactineus]|nr:hypothetical protein C8Q73DRAFT_339197 [Cubamyces lactineus]
MAPRRNMGWRKPVPKLSPESSMHSGRQSRTAFRRLSFTIVNKDVPPLPTDWRESIETALRKEKRYAVYVSPPPSPPPKDGVESRPESLAPTLVEQQEETASYEPPHTDNQAIQCVRRPQTSPAMARRPSQKSLPQIYRPPTPPLPAQHPKLRPAALPIDSSTSITNTLYSGLVSAERQRITPSPNTYAENVSGTSRKPDDWRARRRCDLASAGNEMQGKRPAGGPPCANRTSATSTSTGNRSFCGRSYLASDVCTGVWSALKGWGLHVRAKMSGHAGKY